jgi:hypothetical protein
LLKVFDFRSSGIVAMDGCHKTLKWPLIKLQSGR